MVNALSEQPTKGVASPFVVYEPSLDEAAEEARKMTSVRAGM
jgi:hypothetical protein